MTSPSNQPKRNENTLVDQTNLLPRARLIIVFGTLAFAFLITYADQNGIAVILPTMAKDLNAQDTISWAGTSSFVGNTVFQVLYGRLSDLFGRKVVYLSALLLLAVGDILCATAQNGTSLYIFRALAGIAMGGINSLTMIIVSDIVTLQQRGYYQGLLGGCIGLGNMIGPFVSAAFAETSSWRNFFYLVGPLAAASAVISFFLVPSSMPPRKRRETFSMIDYYGIATGSIAIVFFLVPISGGGSYFKWSSPMVISMFVISALALVAFLLVEWKVSRLPVMPRKSTLKCIQGTTANILLPSSVYVQNTCRQHHTCTELSVWFRVLRCTVLPADLHAECVGVQSNSCIWPFNTICCRSNGVQRRLRAVHIKKR